MLKRGLFHPLEYQKKLQILQANETILEDPNGEDRVLILLGLSAESLKPLVMSSVEVNSEENRGLRVRSSMQAQKSNDEVRALIQRLNQEKRERNEMMIKS